MALPLDEVPAAGIVIGIAAEADLIRIRQALRAEGQRAGLGLVDQTKLITAGSELARNIITYATGSRGGMQVEQLHGRHGRAGIRATFCDDGPGIGDVDAALRDGFSTTGSLGLGLPGAKRLADEMTIESDKEHGTTIVIVKWAR
jgi:serine/threonine-protein kinase RsbT